MAINVKELKPFIQMFMAFMEPRIVKSENKLDDLGLVTVQTCLESDKWLTAVQAAIDSGVPVDQIVTKLKGMMS